MYEDKYDWDWRKHGIHPDEGEVDPFDVKMLFDSLNENRHALIEQERDLDALIAHDDAEEKTAVNPQNEKDLNRIRRQRVRVETQMRTLAQEGHFMSGQDNARRARLRAGRDRALAEIARRELHQDHQERELEEESGSGLRRRRKRLGGRCSVCRRRGHNKRSHRPY